MLQATSSSQNPSPAASFLARINSGAPQARSQSLSTGGGPGPGPGSLPPAAPDSSHAGSETVGADVRRAQSLKNPMTRSHDMSGLSSFTAAGADLAGATPQSANSNFNPPAAARHALFSHHARPIPAQSDSSPSHIITSPPSPSGSSASALSSGAFSPGSAFLSHFSSGGSNRGQETLAPDAQGARVLDYTLGKVLGRGGFSTVRQAIHVESGDVLACKIVKRDDLSDESGSLERFEDEIRIWKSLPQHHSLMPLFEMHRTQYATFLIMPFLPGGSLLDVLRREGGSEDTARKWFPGVVAAVSALHDGFDGFEGIMLHGDLKLDNFMVDHQGGVRLSDFGLAQTLKPGGGPGRGTSPAGLGVPSGIPKHLQMQGRISSAPSASPGHPGHHPHHHSQRQSRSPGPNRRRDTIAATDVAAHTAPACPSASLPYASPELLRAPPMPPSLAQDIWAVGVILHALLLGRLPFTDAFDPRLQMKILRGQWDEPSHLGHEWMEALHGTMNKDVKARWTIRQVRECDAVTGWREVKPRIKSRSRSRARIPAEGSLYNRSPAESPVHDGRRGRDRARDHSRASRSRPPHQRGGSYANEELGDNQDHRFLARPTQGTRSRSQSANRGQSSSAQRPALSVNVDETPHRRSARNTPDEKLAHDLEGVAITRGRSKHRTGHEGVRPLSVASLHVPEMSTFNDRAPSTSRSPSAPRRPLSYHSGQNPIVPGAVPPGSEPRTRSRTRWVDGVPGSGTSSGMHTPSRSGSRPRGSPPTWPTADATASRPPTFGEFELDVVDEEDRRRGRMPASRGRTPPHSRIRGHPAA